MNFNFSITLRKTTIDDLPLLQKWQKEKHIQETIPGEYWNWENMLKRNPPWREKLIVELIKTGSFIHSVKPIGFIQIIDPRPEETGVLGRNKKNKRALDIWIGEKEELGKGYGKKMLQLVLKRCFQNAQSVNEVLLDPLVSNHRAIKLYKRLGFQFIEKRRFGNHLCAVYSLSREKWEQLYGAKNCEI